MSFRPSPRQVLALWRMLFTEEEPKQSDLAAFLGKNGAHARGELVKAGFIQLEKRGRAKCAVLTDHAWAWAAENLDAEISMSKYAAPVMRSLLGKLDVYMRNRHVVLAEIFGKIEAPEVDAPISEEHIEQAYYRASSGRKSIRVRLYALRELLPEVPKEKLDALLLSMQRKGKLVLYSLDDPQEIGPADEAAALDVGGFKRHIVYMGG